MQHKEKKSIPIQKQKTSKAVRLQKVIAFTGLCSRRRAEELITEGKVKVNGKIVNKLGTKIDPEIDEIKIENKKLILPLHKEYSFHVLNKPSGYITSMSDQFDRPIVMNLLPRKQRKLKPVGRLDFNTEGILLFTDDGDLIYRLTHPKYGIRRKYLVRAQGCIEKERLHKIAISGAIVDGVKIKDIGISNIRHTPSSTWFEIEIGEGKNREVRKIVQALGSDISRLKRIAYGPIYKNIPPKGKHRELSEQEIKQLYSMVGLNK